MIAVNSLLASTYLSGSDLGAAFDLLDTQQRGM